MKYGLDEEKAKDKRPTTIVINCTFGEKYRCINAAREKGQKLVPWALETLLDSTNGTIKPVSFK